MGMSREVITIFKTHLDVGFTDLAANVTEKYFSNFIENAVKTADYFREQDKGRRYCWTVGSWLIYEYLEQADRGQREFLDNAILRGDIVWHALPFTMHSELMNPSLFRAGLQISRTLDKRFGRKTIAAKMTDVPGHTRGIIAPLAEAGIKLLHIGGNPASTVPDVPPLFRWEDCRGNSVVVIYQPDYGTSMQLPGTDTILDVEVTGDNTGPHSPDEVEAIFKILEDKYPDAAVIRTGTLDDIAERIGSIEDSLPVIRQEIGDTWIHGVGTDPLKVSRFKSLCRLRRKWISLDDGNQGALEKFSVKLLQVAEHTWGMDEKTWLPEDKRCQGRELEQLLDSMEGKRFASSWQEQRDLLDQAVTLLPTKYAAEAERELKVLQPVRPDLIAYKVTEERVFQTRHFEVGFDTDDGSIDLLKSNNSNHIWSDSNHHLFRFFCENFSVADYERFMGQYLCDTPDWALRDFAKPFLPKDIEAGISCPAKAVFYHRQESDYQSVIVHLEMVKNGVIAYTEDIYLEYKFPDSKPEIEFSLSWFNKKAERLPHSIWFSLCPLVRMSENWQMNKLGEMVSPLDVVSKGARNLHAINDEIVYKDKSGQEITISSLDAPLVAPGKPSLLNFTDRQPDMSSGFHFNLYNNVWGTNFPMWYGDDSKFRFVFTADVYEK